MALGSRFDGDQPIEDVHDDRLGFGLPAEKVSRAIQNFASVDGFVLGLEGAWGSGKSSMINLVAGVLRKAKDAPEIVRFSPWLISSRDALLSELFSEIGRAIAKIDLVEDPESSRNWIDRIRAFGSKHLPWGRRYARRRRLIDKRFAEFQRAMATVGRVADAAALAGVPWASTAAKGADSGFLRRGFRWSAFS